MTVSIIIVVKTWQKNLEECVNKCRELDYPDFEILVLPDASIPEGLSVSLSTDSRVKIIPTGAVSVPEKRDVAIGHTEGDILAFIDDDAWPQKDWLKCAMEDFKDDAVAAVGGPAITPSIDTLRQQASGLVYSSFLVSGKYVYRYLPKKKIEVDDFPTCNLLVRKVILQELGGFQTTFWPGEDTKLCLDITKKLGKKIIYDPAVLVFHHRRPLFIPHIKQVASYALHRGYFVKKFPSTSLRPAYFIPSLFLLALFVGGTYGLLFSWMRIIYLLGLSLYLLLVFIFSIRKDLRLAALVFPGIIMTHFAYGIYFLKGLVSPLLREEKR
ncbi:MAG: glycosyltransferase [Candidatus Omnitrophica bacterium]|nr:glycosyltransferase [Candidatus Omnitrophota bacterium]